MNELPKPPPWYIVNGDGLAPDNETARAYVRGRAGKRVCLAESEHSLKEHGMLFKFVEYLWMTYWTEKFPVFENFRYYISVSVGWAELQMRKTKGGQWLQVLEKKSWSFSKANHPNFHLLACLISEWAEKAHGVSIDEWKSKSKREHGNSKNKIYKLKEV